MPMPVDKFDLNELKRRMTGAVQVLKQELGGLRTGRASTALLDHVQAEAYGSHMPLNQLATISVPEARMIMVQVWDRSMVHTVEKAISAARSTAVVSVVKNGLPVPPANMTIRFSSRWRSARCRS